MQRVGALSRRAFTDTLDRRPASWPSANTERFVEEGEQFMINGSPIPVPDH